MSDTPRVDAEMFRSGDSDMWAVSVDIARQLERENAELLALCKRGLDGTWCTARTCVAGGCLCNAFADAIAKFSGGYQNTGKAK